MGFWRKNSDRCCSFISIEKNAEEKTWKLIVVHRDLKPAQGWLNGHYKASSIEYCYFRGKDRFHRKCEPSIESFAI